MCNFSCLDNNYRIIDFSLLHWTNFSLTAVFCCEDIHGPRQNQLFDNTVADTTMSWDPGIITTDLVDNTTNIYHSIGTWA